MALYENRFVSLGIPANRPFEVAYEKTEELSLSSLMMFCHNGGKRSASAETGMGRNAVQDFADRKVQAMAKDHGLAVRHDTPSMEEERTPCGRMAIRRSITFCASGLMPMAWLAELSGLRVGQAVEVGCLSIF